MTPLRWRAAVRQLNGRSTSLPSRIASGAAESRTYIRPRTATAKLASGRVQVLPSRVSPSTTLISSRQYHLLFKEYSDIPRRNPIAAEQQILQSAFPTKTVLALLVLGTAAYFFIDVQIKDWADDVLNSFHGDPGATPLHFYKDRDEVDHWIQYHIPDPSAPLRDPEILRQINERFAEVAFGWEMGEEDSKEWGMPMTHGVRFRSNEPCEDYYALGTAPGPGSKPWNYWSIYDGHAGRHTAYYLQWTLHPNLSRTLSNLSPSSSSSVIHATIKDVFVKTDNDIMTRAKHAANWYPAANAAAISALSPAFSGSCALLAAFDPETSKLRVACTGDSRAVLGRWDTASEKYIAQPLSTDQTGFNEAEVARLAQEHPDEPHIIDPKSGRLLGIAVTRAFGDHRWKWDDDFIKQVQIKFWGTAPRPNPNTEGKAKTPPYMTAEPVVTETDIVRADPKLRGIDGGKSDFMIMASDGLWDHISSAHAVECVQRWLEARERGNGRVSSDPQIQPPVFTNSFNLDDGVAYDVADNKEVTWQATPEYFAIEDDNAAVCLARNAMGGTRRGLFLGLLSIPGPQCRYAVDDTTIMVVFFDKVDKKDGGGKKRERSRWWPWTRIWDAEAVGEGLAN